MLLKYLSEDQQKKNVLERKLCMKITPEEVRLKNVLLATYNPLMFEISKYPSAYSTYKALCLQDSHRSSYLTLLTLL